MGNYHSQSQWKFPWAHFAINNPFSYRTRGTPGSREASILSVVTVNTLLAVVAGICIHFLYEAKSETITYAINGGLMLWMCLFADIMFLISKVGTL